MLCLLSLLLVPLLACIFLAPVHVVYRTSYTHPCHVCHPDPHARLDVPPVEVRR